MRLLIVAVGRLRDPPVEALCARWAGRCPWPIETVERAPRGAAADPARRRELEGGLLLASVPPGAKVVALDERGHALDSAGFAALLGRWREAGGGGAARPAAAFLVGGADGHGAAVRARADLLLSLGPMTWPHGLVRALLTEQLYRASAILAGHPYHRDG